MATFKAKARAVELLGKGQIADLPTAITELWKNGYDAYAKNLICKLFLETYKDNNSPIFVLSDDGFGMSESDILNRWFVLGTDSKARGEDIKPHFGLTKRIPMGEKGIGRLSVSYLGNQMLMLSKKKGEKANALMLDWRILENYDFFLEDLNIPLFNFLDNKEFDEAFKNAKESFVSNLTKDSWEEQHALRNEIFNDWNEVKIPSFIREEIINHFNDEDYHGTSFIILKPHDQLLELSGKDRINFKDDNSLIYLRASLSGMHNDLKNPNKDFETHFYLYDGSGKYDLIDDFFTKEEMQNADHWLKGEFDENGFFTGEIRIYNKREKYTFKPNRPPGKTAYGPFKIEWGALEGNQSGSLLNEEQYQIVNNKLKTFGGIYVYRDEFRVLPYGRTDVDFLEFEKRRNLGAGYYYFAHRRFMGYIDISRGSNPNLRDKAGREGFIQNKAYREFKDDLIDLFVDIAKKYMRKTPDGEEDTYRQLQISQLEEKYKKQLEAAKKKSKNTKKAFIENLNGNFDPLASLKKEISQLENLIKEEVDAIEINYNNYHKLIEEIERSKISLRELKIIKPQGVKITQRQEKQYYDYQNSYRLAEDKMNSCVELIDDSRERINKENLKLEYNEKFRGHIKYLNKLFEQYRNVNKNTFERINSALKDERETQTDLFKVNTDSLKLEDGDTNEQINAKIRGLRLLTEDQIKTINDTFGGFINHLNNLQIDVDDDFLRGWYQEQNEKLEERLRDYEELAQLGISIEIIDHQFNVMYSQMNDAISEIDFKVRGNDKMTYPLKQLKSAFQHLEGNYKLLKPLYRTSRRTREVILGKQIELYIKEFFSAEFKRYRVDFKVNDQFREYEFFTYESIIKPVFLNIISNANYWLIPVEERKILIEYVDNEIRIMNSGERIDDAHLEDVFTLFFTRKREGRGIGLYLVKRNLQSIGYDIYATNDKEKNKLNGACFVITKNKP